MNQKEEWKMQVTMCHENEFFLILAEENWLA